MRAPLPVLAALLAVAATAADAAPPTSALSPLRQEVADRLGLLEPDAPRKERRGLERARNALAAVPADLAGELKVLSRAAKALSPAFGDSPALRTMQLNALSAMSAVVYAEIAYLETRAGTLPGPREEKILAKGIASAGRLLDGVFSLPLPRRAAVFARACVGVERTAARLGIEFPTDPGDPDPDPDDPVPAFALSDVNANSPRAGQTVSPRDYLGGVSAWYFGHAT